MSSCSWEYWRQLIAKSITFFSFHGTVTKFYRWGGQKQNCLWQIYSRCCVPKIFLLVHFCLSHSRNNRVAFSETSCTCAKKAVGTSLLMLPHEMITASYIKSKNKQKIYLHISYCVVLFTYVISMINLNQKLSYFTSCYVTQTYIYYCTHRSDHMYCIHS